MKSRELQKRQRAFLEGKKNAVLSRRQEKHSDEFTFQCPFIRLQSPESIYRAIHQPLFRYIRCGDQKRTWSHTNYGISVKSDCPPPGDTEKIPLHDISFTTGKGERTHQNENKF